MKKVMIGLLFLIPIIVLLLVAAVSTLVSTSAYIGVESVTISSKTGATTLVFNLSELGNDPIDLNNYLSVEVLPEKVTNGTIEWTVSDIRYLDDDYAKLYNYYLENKETAEKVNPAVMMIDESDNEVDSNTTGLMRINTYCSFTVVATAEAKSDSISCEVVGYDVEDVNVVDASNDTSKVINVADKIKLFANVTPIDSIIDTINWYSSDESILKVDSNGVVTAIKNGEAYIYLKASKYSTEEFVESDKYYITVKSSLSIYGTIFSTHKNSLVLNEYGIENVTAVSGGTIDDGVLSITSSQAILQTSKGEIKINKCLEKAIIIDNETLLNSESGEVVEVDGRPIVLSAKYLSVDKTSLPTVVWSSSNESIATVENGVVLAKSSGNVIITATCDGETASIELNVQKKVTTMSLSTSNTYYTKVIGGLAREHVFASEEYVDIDVDNSKEANSTYIIIKGSDELDGSQLADFLNAYKFEIVSGSEYAYFDDIEVNKLVFKPALEGKNKQEIIVKVSAKYPKYVTRTNYTQEEVTIKAVYGVEVTNIYELKQATLDQKSYAFEDGNLIVTTNDPRACYNLTRETKVSSKNTYAITLTDHIKYPRNWTDRLYTGAKDLDEMHPILYGSIYGNGYSFASYRELMEDVYETMFAVSWSNVTISNITIRANELEGNTEIVSGDETQELKGKPLSICSDHPDYDRITNLVLEYSIFENSYQTFDIRNADVYFNGCIIRNLCNVGAYVPSKVFFEDGQMYPYYARVALNNCVVSNALGSAFSFAQEGYLVDSKTNKNNFSKDDEENLRIAKEYQAQGYCNEFVQTGFFDVYNWQSTEETKLIQSGNPTVDSLLAGLTSEILNVPILDSYRYRYNGVDYFNLGFIVSGISTAGSSFRNEKVVMNVSLSDTRFSSFSLTDFSSEDKGLLSAVKNLNMTIYGYSNTSDLKPYSTLKINDKFIDKLHK